ncbi:MAG: tetratricopeptide repeat protein [Gemmatimonadales bacterium]|nr:tetratricopeptide repeat protein [Gemmatimonadales bacterium]
MRRLFLPVLVLLIGLFLGCSSGSMKKMEIAGDSKPVTQLGQAAVDIPDCVPGLSGFLALDLKQQAQWRKKADGKLGYFREFQEDRDRLMNWAGRILFQEGTHMERSRLGVGLNKSMPGLLEAVRLDPSHCEVWAMLGHLTSEVGRKHQAMKYLDTAKCVAMSLAGVGRPVDPELMLSIYRDRAWIYRDLAQWEEGLAEVREGLGFRKGDHDLVLIKGLLLAGDGQVEAAQALATRMKPFKYRDMRHEHLGIGMRTSIYANNWIRSQSYLAIGDIESACHVLGALENEPYKRELPHLSRFWNDVGLVKELAGDDKAGMYYSLGFLSREYGGFYPATPGSLMPVVLDVPDPNMPFLTSFGRQFFVGGSPLAYAASQMELMSLGSVQQQRDSAARRSLEALDIAQRRAIRPEICQAMRGRVHYQNEDFHLAEPQLLAARSIFQEQDVVDAGTSQLLGMIELREKHYEEAIPFFKEALSADPKSALGWRHLGVALCKTGLVGEAEKAMNHSLQLEPNSVAGLYNRGLFLCHVGRYGESLGDLEKAISMDPGNPQIQQLIQLATLKIQHGETKPLEQSQPVPVDAPAREESGKGIFDGNTDALLTRLMEDLEGFFSLPQGSVDLVREAEAEREALLVGYDEYQDPQVRRLLALTCMELGRLDEAREILAPHWGEDLDPDEAVMLLFADYKVGDPGRARMLGRSLHDGRIGTENPYLWALAVQAVVQNSSPGVAREMKLAFENFVSFNMNFLGNPADQWSGFFAEAFDRDADRTGIDMPAKWVKLLENRNGETEE